MKDRDVLSRRHALAALSLAVLVAAGCGGGGGSDSGRATTRKKVLAMDAALGKGRGMALDDVQGILTGGMNVRKSPMVDAVGGYLQPNNGRGKKTRQEPSPYPDPRPYPDPFPYPTPAPSSSFYKDFYLDLWVQLDDSVTETRYAFFEDEAKTVPAGSIVSKRPDYYVYPVPFPQVTESVYEILAGPLKNTHGFSRSTTQENYASQSAYENIYADGWQDRGGSTTTGRGDYTWFSRTQTPDGKWVEATGSFRSDGSGGTRLTTSDGDVADYTFQANGSGRGTITGTGDGLPVTLLWDNQGNTTVRYADGTIETIKRSYYAYPIDDVGGGTGGGGSVPPSPPILAAEGKSTGG